MKLNTKTIIAIVSTVTALIVALTPIIINFNKKNDDGRNKISNSMIIEQTVSGFAPGTTVTVTKSIVVGTNK